MARRTVIMAAGSPLFSRGLMQTLFECECDVVPVRKADDARSWVASGAVQMCVIQDALVHGSGLDLCAELTASHPSIPVVLFSRDATVEPTAKEKGAVGFIRVPTRGGPALDILKAALDAAPPGTAGATPAASAVAPIGAAPTVTVAEDPGAVAEDAKRILLVDDSKVIHTHVGGLLRTEGYVVLNAMDGGEGLSMAKAEMPDLIISDVEMPNMDGFEMCSQIKEDADTAQLPILILSSRGASVDMDRGFDSGANDYLTKPVDEDDLLTRVLQMLGLDGMGQRERVVVAEDSMVQRNLIVQGLEQQGFEVIPAVDGKEALDLILEDPPDLVITDFDMPEMDGRELTRAIRQEEHLKELPVVMLTAADSDKDRQRGLHAGVNAYLGKPFVPDKIIVIAEKLIAEHRLKRESAAMQRYLSDAAIDAANKAADAAHGEHEEMQAKRRFVSVLFTHIVDFSSMTETMDAEELVTLMNEYFDAVTPLFKDNGGVIDKFIGDCVMGVFRGEDDMENADYAFAAVKTGVQMIKALKEFNEGHATPLDIRVGINSGVAIMGDIGAAAVRRDHTVIGDSVNLAARLESNAEDGTVLISEGTYDLVEDRIVATELDSIMVKGKSMPIHVFRAEDFIEDGA
jgi:DNA-binding response OmpR family regulator